MMMVTVTVMMGNAVGNRGCKLTVAEAKQHGSISEHSPNGSEKEAIWPFDKGQRRQAEDEQVHGSIWGMLGSISAMSRGTEWGSVKAKGTGPLGPGGQQYDAFVFTYKEKSSEDGYHLSYI